MRTTSIIPGLVSVTFRAMPAEQIVALAVRAKLAAIEWGGDVHVPHGDLTTAAGVRRMCDNAGIAISAYGSYYRAGSTNPLNPSFEAVLDTTQQLGTSRIRLWAGERSSVDADRGYRKRIEEDLRGICAAASSRAIAIGLEFHAGTLTDSAESAMRLCDEVGPSNLVCNWQPRVGSTVAGGLNDINMLRPRLGDVHVFQFRADHSRLPLRDGFEEWRAYLKEIGPESRRFTSLEFVRGDDPEQLLEDARTLHELIGLI
jgi:sugar phosphate isomerase/epimerase